jgi:carbamoyltransferase
MKILGISSYYHDASASIVIDGKVVASAAEERFSLEKHDPSFPTLSIDFCLKQANIQASDIDLILYHEDPQTKFSRALASSYKNFPFSVSSFVKSARDMLTAGFWVKNDISKALDISPDKIITIPHHMSHAAHAFLTSPFEEAAIMTIDAAGEWSTACIFIGKKLDKGYSIEPIDVIPFPHSLGLVYSAFTGFLGFKVNDGECSTMALAGFGKPTYIDDVRKIIAIKEDGSFNIDISYFDFSSDVKLPLTDKFIEVFGSPRSFKEKIEFSSMQSNENVSIEQKRYADIAASIQFVLEEAVIAFANRTKTLTSLTKLCYAGGVALNCVANSKLIKENIFENIFVPPDPGDGGGSMGAALYGSMLYDKNLTAPNLISPYMGKCYTDNEFEEMLRLIDPKNWHRYSKIEIKPLSSESISILRLENQSDLISFVSKNLIDRKIIGWHQDRFENGPRALGNRSILCRPDCLITANRLSTKIKLRSAFRPYACSINVSDAYEFLEIENNLDLGSWMQTSYKIKLENWDKLRACSHVDRTTRAQIVEKKNNPLYYSLLNEFKNEFGIAALLNTSFNEQGFPIASSPYDALVMFARTELDILVINNLVIVKRYK